MIACTVKGSVARGINTVGPVDGCCSGRQHSAIVRHIFNCTNQNLAFNLLKVLRSNRTKSKFWVLSKLLKRHKATTWAKPRRIDLQRFSLSSRRLNNHVFTIRLNQIGSKQLQGANDWRVARHSNNRTAGSIPLNNQPQMSPQATPRQAYKRR